MTVLVTGSTGRLGPRLVERLLREGRPVRVLTRRPFLADRLYAGRVEVHEWHPGSEDVPAAALDGIAAIVHMMGAPFSGRATALQLERIRASRVTTTAKLVAALTGRSVRLVAVSLALPPAGAAPGDTVSEVTPRPAPATPFEADLLAAEAAALAGAGHGSSVAVVRLGLLLAPGEPWARLVELAQRGLMVPLAGALVPAIDPDDAVAMLAGLVARPDIEGVVYGVAPEPIPGEQLLAQLAAACRLPARCTLPRFLAVRLLGPLAPLLLGRVRLVPRRLLDAGAEFMHPAPLQRAGQVVAMCAGERRRWPIPGIGPARAGPARQARATQPPEPASPADEPKGKG